MYAVRYLILGLFICAATHVRGERLTIVDVGLVQFDGIHATEDEPGQDRNAELTRLETYLAPNKASFEALSHEYLLSLVEGNSEVDVVSGKGMSRTGQDVDPDRILVWMMTLRHVGQSLKEVKGRRFPILHYEWYLLNPATQLIVFRQSATVLMNRPPPPGVEDPRYSALAAGSLKRALNKESAVKERLARSFQNYQRGFLTRTVWAVDPGKVDFSPELLELFDTALTADTQMKQTLAADTRLHIASELNNIYSGDPERVMLPLLPDDLLQKIRLGSVNESNFWIIFNSTAAEIEDLSAGRYKYNEELGLLRLSAKLPKPTYLLGAKVHYAEDVSKEISLTPGRRRIPGALEVDVSYEFISPDGTPRIFKNQTLHATSNPNYAKSSKVVVGLKGFNAAIKALYASYNPDK